MRLIWSLRSLADLDRIWLFLADRDLDIAGSVVSEIRQRAERLNDYPRIGRPLARTVREWSIPDLHYILTYEIDEGRVRILRVHHARENRERP